MSWRIEFEDCTLRDPRAFEEGRCDWCGEPLPLTKEGKVPKNRRWCKHACRYEFEKNHHWGTARRMAKRRDKYQCVICGSKDQIQVDHMDPLRGKGYAFGCSHHVDRLRTLCIEHHVWVTTHQNARHRHEYVAESDCVLWEDHPAADENGMVPLRHLLQEEELVKYLEREDGQTSGT